MVWEETGAPGENPLKSGYTEETNTLMNMLVFPLDWNEYNNLKNG